MKKIKWNYIVKIVAFISVFILILLVTEQTFNYKQVGGGGGWQRFYDTEKDSIDIMFFGSSHAHCTVDLGYLWDEYGMAGYTLSAGSQNIAGTYFFIKEALQTQRPKVIVIECYGMLGGSIENSDADVYRNTLGMRWGRTLWEYVGYLRDNMAEDHVWAQRVFAKIPIIHSRYAELEQADFQDAIPFMRGYRGSFERAVFERPESENVETVSELHPERLEMLENIITLAQEYSTPVVLFASPYILEQEAQMQYNAIEQWAKQKGIPFINFNHLYDEIRLDFQQDFRDWEHVNNSGAKKVTAYLGEYLTTQYDLPDRRDDANYVAWKQNALYLRNKELRYQLEQAADINEYLGYLSHLQDEQMVIVALTGNYKALGEAYLDALMKLGISREEYELGGLWIYSGGERMQYLPGTEYDYFERTAHGEIHLTSYKTEEGEYQEIVNLMVHNENYRMIVNGINIIVYNKELDQIIDAAGDDIYLGLELIHNEKDLVEW